MNALFDEEAFTPTDRKPHMTDSMLTANQLEKIIELEDNLRGEYQAKLDAKSAELERSQQQLADQRKELQATIDRQLESLTDLSSKAAANQKIEQQNRELGNRAEKLQTEITTLKKRAKALQKDLAETRAEIKTLKQFDPARMKKNLDATKKKLTEQTRANELLQKSLNKTRTENLELQHKVKELEEKLAQLSTDEDSDEGE